MRKYSKVSIISLLFVLLVLLLSLCETSATGTTCNSSSKAQTQNNTSILNLLTSKTVGGIIKAFSYVWKWLPELPESIRPPPPTFRIIKSPDRHDSENEIPFDDFD